MRGHRRNGVKASVENAKNHQANEGNISRRWTSEHLKLILNSVEQFVMEDMQSKTLKAQG